MLTARSARVARARRLRHRRDRAQRGAFLAEGPQAVREAQDAGRLLEVYATPAALCRWPSLAQAAVAAGIPVHACDEAAVTSLCGAVTPQGLVAVCATAPETLDGVLRARPRLLLLGHEVRDPGNAGSVIRVADAAGADAVLLSHGSVDPTNDKAVRASTGSVFHLPVVTGVDTAPTVAALRAAGVQVLAADVTATAVDLDDAADAGLLRAPTAWLFGNEAHGLPPAVRDCADAVVRVPLHGRAESLNLATAAAVCLYASARAQRRRAGDPPGP